MHPLKANLFEVLQDDQHLQTPVYFVRLEFVLIMELADLQQQFLTEEDKKNLKPVVPPRKPKIAIKKPNKQIIPQKPVTSTTQISQSIDRNKQIKQRKLAQQKALTQQKKAKASVVQKKEPSQVVAKTVPKIMPAEKQQTKIEEDLHPMDTICGGRNRFLQGCR